MHKIGGGGVGVVTEKQTVQAKKVNVEQEVTTERDYIELVATYTKLKTEDKETINNLIKSLLSVP